MGFSQTKLNLTNMKHKLLLLVALLAITSGFSQKKWSLKECVDYALKNNITIQQNKLSVGLAEEDYEIAEGNFLPAVNSSIGSGINAGLTQDEFGVLRNTTNFTTNLNLGVNGTIFNGYRNLNTYRQAKLGIESSKLTLKQIENDISLQVVNTYLNVLFAKENYNVAKFQAEISQGQIKAFKEQYENGLIPKADYLNVEATAANDLQNQVTQENVLTIALLNLSQLLQLPSEGFDIEYIDVGSPANTMYYANSNIVYEKALTTQPQIRNAELGIENAELDIELAKGAFYPTLTYNVFAGSSYFNQFNNLLVFRDSVGNIVGRQRNDNFIDQLNDRFQYGASVSLNIPIFNRFQTKNRVDRAEIDKEISELNLINEKLQLEQTIEQAYTDAKAAAKAFEAAKISLESQREAFKNAKQSFELGAMTVFDFDLVRNRLVSAESTLIRNKYDYVFRTKVLQFFYGELRFD